MTPSPSSFITPLLLFACSSLFCPRSLASAPPAPTPAPSPFHDSNCGPWPVNYQIYEQDAMVALLRAWNKSYPDESRLNISNWKESVHPCNQSSKDSAWRGVQCRGMLVDHATGSSACEMFLVGLDGEDFGITGELVPEIGDLRNLEFIYINHNPGQSGPIPESIWELPNLREVQFINNSLSGNVILYNSMYDSALERVDLSHNYLTSFSLIVSSWPALKFLNISSNLINCPFPPWSDFDQFTSLSEVYMDQNNITGTLDISTFFKSNISATMTVLSVKGNNITTVIYTDDYAKEGRTKILLQGNPFCDTVWFSEADATRCSVYCEHTCKYEKSNKWKVIVAATSTSSSLVLVSALVCFGVILRRNQKCIRTLQKKIRKADINARRFEYTELRAATKNFAPEMKLGAGAGGAVYKGILPNNTVVAVKQLFLETSEGRDDFLNEVLLISNLQHRNLVTLKGYCLRGKQTLLVYEYVENCDLDKLLLRRDNAVDTVLDWRARRNVCQGVAQGLYYLHASSQFRIIHRDIKASNILLDKHLQPKIADFGLARPIEDARSVILTQQCAGTLGYLAPEYMCHGQLSEKADVYSFGILLLEIVSGKRNRVVTVPEDDDMCLPVRVWRLHKENRLLDMKDATLVVSKDEAREVQQVLETAMLCVQTTPEKRPSMFQVTAMLTGDASADVPPVDDGKFAEEVTMDEFRISIQ